MKFENPYSANLPSDYIPDGVNATDLANKRKSTVYFPEKVVARLTRCRPQIGTFQTTIAILVKKLIEQLDANQLNTYDRERYEQAVANATIRLGGDGGTVAISNNKPRRKSVG